MTTATASLLETPVERVDFIKGYREYAAKLSDAPQIFHDVLSLAAVGAALGNRVYIDAGVTRLYPNFYALLVGTSGCGKSYALSIAANILDGLESADPKRVVPRHPNSFSAEALFDALREHACGLFVASELAALMGALGRDYAAGAQALLTDVYDGGGKLTVRTRSEGVKSLDGRDLAPSLWAGSTVQWFLSGVREADLSAGWWSRFLIVHGKSERFYPIQPPSDHTTRNRLVRALMEATSLSGPADDSAAKDTYVRWVTKTRETWAGAGVWGAFPRRLHQAARRLALCIEVGRRHSLKVTSESMREACALIDTIYSGMETLQHEEMVFNRTQAELKRVRDIIKGAGRIDRAALLRRSRMKARELNDITATLDAAQEIVIGQEPNASGPPTTIYEWGNPDAKRDGEKRRGG